MVHQRREVRSHLLDAGLVPLPPLQFASGHAEGVYLDTILSGPRPIRECWPSLKSIGFKTVGTILPNRLNPNEAWVFSGYRCAYMHFMVTGTSST
jgi:hypothetical protein